MKIDLFDLFSARSAGVQIHCRLSMQAHNEQRAEIFSVLLISNTPPPPCHIHEGQLLTKTETGNLGHGTQPCAAGQFSLDVNKVSRWLTAYRSVNLQCICIYVKRCMTGHSIALNFTTFMIRNQRSNIQQACTLMHKTVEGLATCTLSPFPRKRRKTQNLHLKQMKRKIVHLQYAFILFAHNTTSFIH